LGEICRKKKRLRSRASGFISEERRVGLKARILSRKRGF